MTGDKIVCSTDDSIDVLDLKIRVRNALMRSKIKSIGALMELDEDRLFALRNLGEKGVAEITERLSKIELLDVSPSVRENESLKEWSGEPQILIDLGPPMIPRHEVVKWQQMILVRQIEAGIIHPQLQVEDYRLAELVDAHSHTAGLYEILLKILTAPISISQELEQLLGSVPQRELDILIRRFGFDRQTLETVASALGITRERVRQIEKQAIRRVLSSAFRLPFARIRSAVLFADNMGLSFDGWSRRLLYTGLLGDWTNERFADSDNLHLELLIVICKLLEDSEEGFEIPESLNYMIKLRRDGKSASPARMLVLLQSFTSKIERLVKRHLRYSGAVSLDWLVNQDSVTFSKGDLSMILESRGYSALDKDWYFSYAYVPEKLEKNSVIHKSLFKIFQYCGPLQIEDIYFGIEHTLSKTDFPVPPIDILEKALLEYGYFKEETCWYWHGKKSEELNSGEATIWNVLEKGGGVAHHSELMLGILDRGLSGATLGATLARSPLFENFEPALYKLRGSRPSYATIDRARSAAATVPMRLTVVRDTYGNISIGANLGILAIANGTLLSENLPNLSGNWQCRWSEDHTSEIRVTHNEIRGLLKVFRHLECQVGDRIELIFNVFDRSVFVQMAGANT